MRLPPFFVKITVVYRPSREKLFAQSVFGSFSTVSGYTSGNLAAERRQLSFADNANVMLKLDGREDLHAIADEHGLVMTWPEDAAAGEDVKFALDNRTKRRGFIIRRDDEANGLRLIYQGGTALILR